MLPISDRFHDAVTLACQLHARQARKVSGIPYISHLFGVAALAMEHGADEDVAIAALLHDAVEDQGGHPTLAKSRKQFGDRVADIVDGCTDAYDDPKPPWRQRKEQYIEHLQSADASVRLVSASDKLHNLRSILSDVITYGDEVYDRFKAGKEGTLWYYRSLVEVFKRTGPARLAGELDRVITELEQVAEQPLET